MNEALFLFLVLITLLLATFLYTVVTAPPQQAAPAEPPPVEPPLPVRRPRAAAPPTGSTDQPSDADYAARHTTAAVPAISPPKVPRKTPKWRTAALMIAGLAAAAAGGWLFMHTPVGAVPCSHQVAEICSDGFVMLTGTQVLGGAIALAGLTLALTGLYRAVR